MDNALNAALARQIALSRELTTVANNIANVSTAGFRREGVVFSEFVEEAEGPMGSLSLGAARGRFVDLAQGVLRQTGGTFDLAIEGEGFFRVETANGPRLTRGGAFTPNQDGTLVTLSGHRLLDEGGAPVVVPPDAGAVSISPDGVVSSGDRLLGRIGLATVADPKALTREADGLFVADEAALAPAEGARLAQGFLEGSNVDPVGEITRMIEVQRGYELAQSLASMEDERIQKGVTTMGRPL